MSMSESSVHNRRQPDHIPRSTGGPKTAKLQQRSVDLNQSSATCNKVMMAVGVVFILAAIAFGVYGGLNNFPMEQLAPITAGLAVIGIALLTIGCGRHKGAGAPQNGPGTPTNPSSHRGENPGGTRGDSHHRGGSSAARRGHGEPHATRRGGHRGTHHSRRRPEAPSTPTFVYNEVRTMQIKNRFANLDQGQSPGQGFMTITDHIATQINSMPEWSYYVHGKSIIGKQIDNRISGAVLDDRGDNSDMKYFVAYLESQHWTRVYF